MADILDQKNYTGSTAIGYGDVGNGRDYMVQGFYPKLNNITAVSFKINSKDGNTNIGYKVWIDTCDANSYPTNGVGGIGGSTELTNAQLVVGTLTKYALATAVNLVIGNKYVICFAPWDTVNHVYASSYNDWVSSTGNPYAPSGFSGARRVHLNTGYTSPSQPDSGNDDLLFETYGLPVITLPPRRNRPAMFKPFGWKR